MKELSIKSILDFLKSGAIVSLEGNKVLISWGKIVRPSSKKWIFYLPDFFLKKHLWISFEHFFLTDEKKFLLCLKKTKKYIDQKYNDIPPINKFKKLENSCPKKRNFKKIFNKIQKNIDRGNYEKIVPATLEMRKYNMDSRKRLSTLINLFSKRLKEYKQIKKSNISKVHMRSLHVYGLWKTLHPSTSNTKKKYIGLLGETPEVLFKYDFDAKVLKTMALAGTKKSDNHASLLKNKKELKEHLFVVKDIKKKSKKINLKTICSKTYEWNVGYLTHLRTDIKIFLKTKNKSLNIKINKYSKTYKKPVDSSEKILKLLNSNPKKAIKFLCSFLHPTAALGGFSQKKHFDPLKELKKLQPNMRRLSFGAPFAVISPDTEKVQALVAIRGIQWSPTRLYIHSGCGVVKDSQYENELSELQNKKEAIKQRLNIH